MPLHRINSRQVINELMKLKKELQVWPPSYFASVMATGIMATASHLQQYEATSTVLFVIAKGAFAGLLLLLIEVQVVSKQHITIFYDLR